MLKISTPPEHCMDSPPNSDPGLYGLATAAAALQRPQSHLERSLTESRKPNDLDIKQNYSSNSHLLPYQMTLQLILQDHNYSAPPVPTPPSTPPLPVIVNNNINAAKIIQPVPVITAPPPDLSAIAALATVADQVRTAGSTNISSLLHLQAEEDSRGSPLSSDEHDDPGLEGEETETAAEGEGDEDSVTRCICGFEHDDGYMICCDKCFVWQHVDCMGIDRTNIPEVYLCELCQPRRVDRIKARNIQLRKQIQNDSSSSDEDSQFRNNNNTGSQVRRLTAAAKKRQAKRENKKVVKRQRRDSAAVAAREQRATERRANKKRDLAGANNKTDSKRIGGRRRSKGKPDSLDEETQDGWNSPGHQSPGTVTAVSVAPQQPQQLRQWIDSYEEAVTNHYSQDLRSRLSSIKVNGTHSDFKVTPNLLQKCRTTLYEHGVKILLSSQQINTNQPIIEIRGKFKLSKGLGRIESPYMLYYTIPKDGTEVCCDATTYGNDARFVRSSCKPNAEVRHCLEKGGSIHLYLVATTTIERNAEITIKHEETGPRSFCKECPLKNSLSSRNGVIQESSSDRRGDRRRRGSRRNTSSEDSSNASAGNSNSVEATPVIIATPAVISPPVVPTSPPAVISTPPETTPSIPVVAPPLPVQNHVNTPVTRRAPKSPAKSAPVTPAPQVSEDSNDDVHDDKDLSSAIDKKKMTREERKMEAIMKAFERMEKAQQRKQETLAKQQKQRPSDSHEKEEEEQLEEAKKLTPTKSYYRRKPRGRSCSLASAITAGELSPRRQFSPGPSLSSPPPQSNEKTSVFANGHSFRFPKLKNSIISEWFSKPVDTPASPVKNDIEDNVCKMGSAAAKKRWLRQAISEESEPQTCNSPRSGSPPGGDYLTPLKKRRLARESLSSEQSFTPPATPASDPDEESTALHNSSSQSQKPPVSVSVLTPVEVPTKINNIIKFPEETLLPASKDLIPPIKQITPEPVVVQELPPPSPMTVVPSPIKTDHPYFNMINTSTKLEQTPPLPEVPPPLPPPPPPPKEVQAVKRKLSISEYRQRKQRAEEDKSSEGEFISSTVHIKAKDDVKQEEIKWNSCEVINNDSHREDLTERLKREFGLVLDEMDDKKMTASLITKQITSNQGTNETAVASSLPPLPPLEPPSMRIPDPHNIPLPPCSPPPLLDLLNDSTSSHENIDHKPVTVNGTITSGVVVGGVGVQNKNQILSSSSSITQLNNGTTSLSKCKTTFKKPIPTSTPVNNSIRPTANSAS